MKDKKDTKQKNKILSLSKCVLWDTLVVLFSYFVCVFRFSTSCVWKTTTTTHTCLNAGHVCRASMLFLVLSFIPIFRSSFERHIWFLKQNIKLKLSSNCLELTGEAFPSGSGYYHVYCLVLNCNANNKRKKNIKKCSK